MFLQQPLLEDINENLSLAIMRDKKRNKLLRKVVTLKKKNVSLKRKIQELERQLEVGKQHHTSQNMKVAR